jgi:hypothetical protein
MYSSFVVRDYNKNKHITKLTLCPSCIKGLLVQLYECTLMYLHVTVTFVKMN